MKKLYTILLLLAAAISAAAQNYSVTVKWDNPGAMIIGCGTISNFVAVELAPDQTSFTITEKTEYVFLPAKGYIFISVDKDGTAVNIGNNAERGSFFYIGGYDSNNGKTFNVSTEKLVYDKHITIEVLNGADYMLAKLENGNDAKKSTNTVLSLVNGKQQIALSQYDNMLTINRNANFSGKSFYSVSRDGQTIESDSKFYPYYSVKNLEDGQTVTIAVRDPSVAVETCTVTIDINEPECLVSIRDWQHSSWIKPEDLTKDWKLEIEKGQALSFNFNEDYNIESFMANNAPVDFDSESGSAKVIINEDTKFSITATAKTYTDVPVAVYLNIEDAVVFTDSYDENATVYELGQGEELTEDVVLATKPAQVIKEGTAKKYTFTVPGKNPKFFWTVKDGFYAEKAYLCNPDDPSYYFANGAVTATEAPLWLDIRRIENTARAVVYYEGPENTAVLTATDKTGTHNQAFEGQTSSLVPGYNEIMFDPDYHSIFKTRKIDGDSDDMLFVYNNGKRVNELSDTPGVFNTTLTDSASLKIFVARRAPAAAEINFIYDGNVSAEIITDKICRQSRPDQIKGIGSTHVAITPANGTYIKIDNEYVTVPENGVFEFTAGKEPVNVILTATASVAGIPATPDDRYTVVSLSGMVLLKNATADKLAKLARGIYIINGTKVILK